MPFVIINCEAPREVLEQRVAERGQAGTDASEADLAVLESVSLSADGRPVDGFMGAVPKNEIDAFVLAALKKQGAAKVYAYITHPVLSGPAVSRIAESRLDEMVVTDTIPLNDEARACDKIRQLSVAEMLAETMRRISFEESVSSLYVD